MAKVSVDYRIMENAAREVSGYAEWIRLQMDQSTVEALKLTTEWQGKDSVEFYQKWMTMTAKGSTYRNMLEAVESYRDYLKYVYAEYQKAQRRAQNLASMLPKF